MIIQFPRNTDLYRAFVARLDEKNEVIDELMQKGERLNLELAVEMSSYLSLLTEFMKTASSDQVDEFLISKGEQHGLNIQEQFQLELDL